ncbi:ribbon-helix-helix protein, CopG family [Paracoccus sp. DMF]|uniref:ribbon-helix-helix protein, CopG family n=1 Tax=Paracoccus sp. DMF TaxID=400837 RepID=UPI0011050D9B|nr:ribbon-helix-helix protein, CopG family [Paracoccus sp. DMF]MCV2449287.1 ribbon-helix-helix protein, CopG family [Paracoccus sp. DMF]
MTDQEKTVLTRKGKRGPAPTGKGTLIGVRVQPDLLDWIDAKRADTGQTRPDFMRDLLDNYMKAEAQTEAEMPTPDTEAAAPTWIREAAARFLLLGARLIRGRKMNPVRRAQAEFYEHLAEIVRKGKVGPYAARRDD